MNRQIVRSRGVNGPTEREDRRVRTLGWRPGSPGFKIGWQKAGRREVELRVPLLPEPPLVRLRRGRPPVRPGGGQRGVALRRGILVPGSAALAVGFDQAAEPPDWPSEDGRSGERRSRSRPHPACSPRKLVAHETRLAQAVLRFSLFMLLRAHYQRTTDRSRRLRATDRSRSRRGPRVSPGARACGVGPA